ncbi:MAG: acyltransferase [Polyangiaceae bacterium]|jgi:peptidoglycan/LPS O-acetylase OafA/YrhL
MTSAERLRGAFSFRRNLRALFVPPEGHLRPLDGLRALSILWVVLFHAGWYGAFHIPPEKYGALLVAPWMLLAWRGDFGVDVFFVLSGFLIAGMLIDEQARTGRIQLGLFYGRRLLRLWPALGVAVLADAIIVGDHADMAWANLFYVSNFVPIADAAMGWTWSLAIEEQFYLVCPWLVRWLADATPRRRLTVLAATASGLCAVGACVVVAGGFHAWDSEIVINRDLAEWARAFDDLYTKPWMRAGPLLAGVAAAYLHRTPGTLEALGRARVPSAVGLGAALVVAAACTHWPFVALGPRALEVAFMATFRTVFGACVAYVLLLSLSPHPAGQFLGRVLSSRVLFPVSQLAYSAYLLNPIATNLVDHALAPLVWLGKAEPMALFLPFDVAATFGAAAVMHVFVERPFMELRPRGPRV